MSHSLTSTAACHVAHAMALERAKLGSGAQVTACWRNALDSYDLAYTVRSTMGVERSVLVTDRALRMRLKRAGLSKG